MTLSPTDRRHQLRKARFWLSIFIVGLFVSGVTAFPLETELAYAVHLGEQIRFIPTDLLGWLQTVHAALQDENGSYPFLAYGTDWLAFAHIVLAVLFLGPWRDPVRNKWVVQFGFLACAGIPFLAFIAGAARGIPFYWRLIDTSFGVIGALVLWPVWTAIVTLERSDVADDVGSS